jgi:hypothetical protein
LSKLSIFFYFISSLLSTQTKITAELRMILKKWGGETSVMGAWDVPFSCLSLFVWIYTSAHAVQSLQISLRHFRYGSSTTNRYRYCLWSNTPSIIDNSAPPSEAISSLSHEIVSLPLHCMGLSTIDVQNYWNQISLLNIFKTTTENINVYSFVKNNTSLQTP